MVRPLAHPKAKAATPKAITMAPTPRFPSTLITPMVVVQSHRVSHSLLYAARSPGLPMQAGD
jgi:hypothetical protein